MAVCLRCRTLRERKREGWVGHTGVPALKGLLVPGFDGI